MIIISGGQTGADQAGWRAAKTHGIETGGWMPLGFRTEDGLRPEFAKLYGAKQGPCSKLSRDTQYAARTRLNVKWSDVTLWFHGAEPAILPEPSPGYRCTRTACANMRKPMFEITRLCTPSDLASLLERYFDGFSAFEQFVNIAGSRESKSPGIGAWVESLLGEALALLKSQVKKV